MKLYQWVSPFFATTLSEKLTDGTKQPSTFRSHCEGVEGPIHKQWFRCEVSVTGQACTLLLLPSCLSCLFLSYPLLPGRSSPIVCGEVSTQIGTDWVHGWDAGRVFSGSPPPSLPSLWLRMEPWRSCSVLSLPRRSLLSACLAMLGQISHFKWVAIEVEI